jgi:hypothetical protein
MVPVPGRPPSWPGRLTFVSQPYLVRNRVTVTDPRPSRVLADSQPRAADDVCLRFPVDEHHDQHLRQGRARLHGLRARGQDRPGAVRAMIRVTAENPGDVLDRLRRGRER